MDDGKGDVPGLMREAAGPRTGDEADTSRRPATRAAVASAARQERKGALKTIAIVIGGLLFAALLNADHLVDRAGKKPFGGDRDFWLAVWQPFQDVSDPLYLNRPRLWIDEAIGHEIPAAVASNPPVTTVTATAVATPATPVAPSTTPRPGGNGATSTATAEATPTVPPTPEPRLRTPTSSWPLTLWVAGDSMAVEFGASLGRMASATGVITPTIDARSSSGLTRPDFYDWPGRLASVVKDDNPDVLVVMFGANDAQGIQTGDGKVFQPLTDGWRDEYRKRVDATMAEISGPHRLVIWVGQPVMETDGFSARMADIDTIFRQEAAKYDGIMYFDSWPLFLDASGKYNSFLPDESGATQNMRASDGVHLTRAGADRLAKAVLGSLDQETPVLP